jgi:ketosteroid isomerase-like protein
MKYLKILSILFVSFFFISSSFAASKLSDEDMSSIKKTIQEFEKNLDTQNADGMEKIISDNSIFVQVIGVTKKTTQYNSSDYLSALKNREIGGWAKQLDIQDVDAAGNTAFAKIQAKDPRMTSTGFITLVKENNDWKIVCATYYMELNQKSASM